VFKAVLLVEERNTRLTPYIESIGRDMIAEIRYNLPEAERLISQGDRFDALIIGDTFSGYDTMRFIFFAKRAGIPKIIVAQSNPESCRVLEKQGAICFTGSLQLLPDFLSYEIADHFAPMLPIVLN